MVLMMVIVVVTLVWLTATTRIATLRCQSENRQQKNTFEIITHRHQAEDGHDQKRQPERKERHHQHLEHDKASEDDKVDDNDPPSPEKQEKRIIEARGSHISARRKPARRKSGSDMTPKMRNRTLRD